MPVQPKQPGAVPKDFRGHHIHLSSKLSKVSPELIRELIRESSYLDMPAHYIGLEDLIRTKRAAGRPQDRLDVQRLLEKKRQPRKRRRSM